MRKKLLAKSATTALVLATALSMTACGGNNNGGGNEGEGGSAVTAADPAEREKITITMGRQTTANPKFPEGDNYEDNAYIRMVEQELNVDIVDQFEANNGDRKSVV